MDDMARSLERGEGPDYGVGICDDSGLMDEKRSRQGCRKVEESLGGRRIGRLRRVG